MMGKWMMDDDLETDLSLIGFTLSFLPSFLCVSYSLCLSLSLSLSAACVQPSLTAAERWVVGFALGMAALVALGAAVGTVIIIRARLRERRGNQTYSSINELTRNEFQVSLSFSRGQRSNGSELEQVTELSD